MHCADQASLEFTIKNQYFQRIESYGSNNQSITLTLALSGLGLVREHVLVLVGSDQLTPGIIKEIIIYSCQALIR